MAKPRYRVYEYEMKDGVLREYRKGENGRVSLHLIHFNEGEFEGDYSINTEHADHVIAAINVKSRNDDTTQTAYFMGHLIQVFSSTGKQREYMSKTLKDLDTNEHVSVFLPLSFDHNPEV